MTVEVIKEELINGAGLDETLKKHGLSLKEAFENAQSRTKPVSIKRHKPKQEQKSAIRERWIQETDGVYQIKFYYEGKDKYFGRYYRRKDAERILEEMEKYNFDKRHLSKVKKKFRIKSTTDNRADECKYYYYYPSIRCYVVIKSIKGKLVRFGAYDTEEQAKMVIDELKKVNWNKRHLTQIKNKLGLNV